MKKKTNRTERLNLRITPELKMGLEEDAIDEGVTLNEFCLRILSNKECTKALNAKAKAFKECAKLFAKMGVNINQLARYCNTTGEAATPKQLLQILEEAKTMQKEILTAFAKKEGG
ncbi:MAG: plasmid mobilization relaxosome protein MobC [Phascolarctobacterium sp.]|nr:plasmid mobilization relaxosome protein MobC [Phascolarctobacterium sp.]